MARATAPLPTVPGPTGATGGVLGMPALPVAAAMPSMMPTTPGTTSPTTTAQIAAPSPTGTGIPGFSNGLLSDAGLPGSATDLPNGRGSTNATQVQISPDILNSMQQYQNAAYQNQQAVLDPQMAQQKAQFDAQMAAQGLQPGSQAYNQAYQQMQQSQNNAYQSAYNNSFQTGLGAQNQAFTQGYDNSQLANALAIANLNKQAQLGAANIGAQASMSNNSANNQTNQLLGLGNLGLGYGNLTNTQNQQDMQNLLGLYGMTSGASQYNNGLIGNSQNTLFGMIPNMNPSTVDVTGAYGLNQSGQNAQYQGQVAQANGTNQMVGALGTAAIMAMMMCSRDVKDDQGPAIPEKMLDAANSLPVHLWNYKGEKDIPHVGTFAEDFNESLGLPKNPTIQIIDMLGVLLGSVQALTKRIEAVERSRAA